MAPEFVRLWEFDVCDATQRDFEQVYGGDGDWVRLFRNSAGFLRTELLKDLSRPGRYLTFDFWKTEADYESFRRDNGAAYSTLDAKCENLTIKEIDLGSFCLVNE